MNTFDSSSSAKSDKISANTPVDGPARLPPPVKPSESVLRSIAALDAIEDSPAKNKRAAPVIDAVVNEQPRKPAPEQPAASDATKKKSQDATQPLRANAFRPNPASSAPVHRKTPSWLGRAAAIAVLLGGGWLIGSGIMQGQLPFLGAHDEVTAQLSPLDLVRQELRQVSGELAAVRNQLAQTDSPELRARQAAEVEALKKSLGDISRRVEQSRNTQTSAVGEIAARLDRARLDEAKQREDIADRLARLESQLSDGRPAGTIAAAQPPNSTIVPRAAFTPPAPAPDVNAVRKPSALTGYVLREVYNGIALIEGRNGFVEAYPGSVLPGAGRVQSISRRGGAWVVVTSNGVIGPRLD